MMQRCPHCRALIGAADQTCPICQYPIPEEAHHPEAPSPPPPPGRSGPRPGRRAVRAVAALGWVAVVGAVAYALWSWSTAEPAYPDQWDPRVTDYVAFVEDARDLRFEHPVYVDFVPEEEFVGDVTTDDEALDDEARDEIDAAAGFLRAFGLAPGGVDLFGAQNDLAGEGILAYYEPATQRVRVRGTELTPAVEATLVHELTHALQDQHFDLERLTELEDPQADSAFRTLVEGDAVRVEDLWVAELGDDDAEAYRSETDEGLDDVDELDVPDILVAALGAPYAIGPSFVDLLDARGGTGEIDAAFEAPPTTEEQLIDPEAFAERQVPDPVDAPGSVDEEDVVDEGELGSLLWYLLLAEHLEPAAALEATDGWEGDAYVTHEVEGRLCVDARFVGATDDDAEEMEDALDDWIEAFPEGDAAVERDGEQVDLRSCDPGDDAPEPEGRSSAALALPVIRLQLAAEAARAGLDDDAGWCIADATARSLTYDQLGDSEHFAGDGFTDQILAARDACT